MYRQLNLTSDVQANEMQVVNTKSARITPNLAIRGGGGPFEDEKRR